MLDGLGWWLEYVATLLKYYPGDLKRNLDFILFELPMDFGNALINAAIEKDGWFMLCGMKRTSPGYIAQQQQIFENMYYQAFPRKGK